MTYRASAIAAHAPAPSQGAATGAQGADLARCNPHGINGLSPVGSDNGGYVNLKRQLVDDMTKKRQWIDDRPRKRQQIDDIRV